MLLLRVDCLSKEIEKAMGDTATIARLVTEMKEAATEARKIIERMRVL